MSKGVKLWEKAKKLIPGGNSLLSKRSDMFLPGRWPSYYRRSKGVSVWDLDGKKYIDMCIMGIGTNILGYGHDEVDAAVIKAVKNGNTSTLNCPEEVELAEKLVSLHRWARMVRYARTGGEACAMAVRIARAASGKEKVAFCGYHGWSDWYLAANLADDRNLDGQLLPGLEPRGVPRGLAGTAVPFEYNRFDQLERIVRDNDIGVIMMEPVRNREPERGFLESVRKLASAKGIVLVFDEITSGFRRLTGGIHLFYGVEPDMAVLGKAMGNGYAVSAVIGKREVMEAAQSTFISSTYWTERTGPAAALAAIKVMEREKAPEAIEKTGRYINQCWQELALAHGLEMRIEGLPALTHFSFERDNLKYKTFVTQEMLKAGYLASNMVYVALPHTMKIIDAYMEQFNRVLAKVKKAMENNDIDKRLLGPVCSGGFRRLL